MKVLIADDSVTIRNQLSNILTNWGIEVITASDGNEAWEILTGDDPPKLAILDWVMPGMDGIEITRKIKNKPLDTYTYVIVLSSKTEKSDIAQGLDAGADDYLPKPFDPLELKARLHVGQRMIDLHEQLRETALRDPLTGLYNHGAILDILEKEVARAKRLNMHLSVCMGDIDHFKRVNDTYGHLTGDRILRECAQRIKKSLRMYDGVGRYGGEEFLLVLSDCHLINAVKLGERILDSIRSKPFQQEGQHVAVTLSLGITGIVEKKEIGAMHLIQAADSALYQAKNKGRDRLEIQKIEKI
ncbi:MAG: diguanylate cyclase [Candidatus Omnitrophota bacterium]|jgi:diguanylate cyclase (GGDEF)-like protein|nr:MAG: diguanylate cyclase [Candidatus Omnitrophota bacterium]